jgi:hypothetical protein
MSEEKKKSKEDKKRIEYANGAVLSKTIDGNKETWTLDNNSLADLKFTIDLTKCKNVKFEK